LATTHKPQTKLVKYKTLKKSQNYICSYSSLISYHHTEVLRNEQKQTYESIREKIKYVKKADITKEINIRCF